MELKGKKINFLGDSITEGVGCSSPDFTFVERIAREYGAVCRNYGISGTRIARQKNASECPQFDLDFVRRAEEMDPDADIVIVFGGTNDFGHGDAPMGVMPDRSVYTFYGALHCLYVKLIERYPASKIIILTPLHRCKEDDPCGDSNKARPVGPLRDYVRAIREVAEYYSLPVLDLFACSGLQPKVPVIKERYIPDGLHPNDEGHRLLSELLASYLKNL